ncbi:MAG: PorT family protein [Flavobacteriaceae bacterium]|nr:PorT family protein [Flavobacteriaceae bacterium]
MKNTKLSFLIALFCSVVAFAQSGSGFGIKGGINYNSNGDFINETQDAINGSESKVGFHAGVYGKIKLPVVYLRPELIYTKTISSYPSGELEIQKIDVPVLVGIDVLGPLHVFGGPSFQYILDNNFEAENIDLKDIENEFSFGLQVGLGVNLGRLGLDVRYERGLKTNEADFVSSNIGESFSGRIDTRPSQLIFAVSLKL